MKDTTKEKDGMKNASDDPRCPVDIRYPSHRRSRLIHLFPASESTEVSDAVDMFITESKTQRLKHNSHRNDGRGSAPLFAGSFASALYCRHCRFMRHVALVVGFWFVMMDPDEDVVVEDVVDDVEVEDEAEEEERIRLFCAIANFIARYFGCTIPHCSTFGARPRRIVGGEGKLSARIHIHVALPCYIERYAKPRRCAHPVEEQVVVTSAQDPANLSSNSMSLYLCSRPIECTCETACRKACRYTSA
jgi:hypothetical protein